MLPTELTVGDREHELASIVALIRREVVTPYRLSAILEELGSAVGLVQQSEADRLFQPESPSHDLIGAVTQEDLTKAVRDVRRWLSEGRDVRTVLDDNYPTTLRAIFNHPPVLFIQGNWDEQRDSWSVAIVGTRKASREGIARARRLSRELSAAGFCIASGMAAGIDTAAHTAALDCGTRTFAVMGTGLDRRFPKENAPLADRILDSGGCLISQFFPTQPPTQWTFPMRNVVMSGLTLATVVVEAAETSGARMQARVALQHGRTVFLLRSLVESHEWARQYVEQGAYGTAAIMIGSTDEILDRLQESPERLRVA
ncbi:MAG: DNA-processing protein DprA [Gemmatimonadota bacterium]